MILFVSLVDIFWKFFVFVMNSSFAFMRIVMLISRFKIDCKRFILINMLISGFKIYFKRFIFINMLIFF